MGKVVWVNRRFPAPAEPLVEREPAEFQPTPIDEIKGAIRKGAPHVCRDRIDGEPQTSFVSPQGFIQSCQLPGCLIEHLPELGQFVFPIDRDLMLEVAIGQSPVASFAVRKAGR